MAHGRTAVRHGVSQNSLSRTPLYTLALQRHGRHRRWRPGRVSRCSGRRRSGRRRRRRRGRTHPLERGCDDLVRDPAVGQHFPHLLNHRLEGRRLDAGAVLLALLAVVLVVLAVLRGGWAAPRAMQDRLSQELTRKLAPFPLLLLQRELGAAERQQRLLARRVPLKATLWWSGALWPPRECAAAAAGRAAARRAARQLHQVELLGGGVLGVLHRVAALVGGERDDAAVLPRRGRGAAALHLAPHAHLAPDQLARVGGGQRRGLGHAPLLVGGVRLDQRLVRRLLRRGARPHRRLQRSGQPRQRLAEGGELLGQRGLLSVADQSRPQRLFVDGDERGEPLQHGGGEPCRRRGLALGEEGEPLALHRRARVRAQLLAPHERDEDVSHGLGESLPLVAALGGLGGVRHA
mmetsp:Transcript_6147/g.20488  ORF Transcript_6147/g.20488 Transcript_6147/m.20488 type:complete len:406 (-) Transcript_6147:217-1434(-)